MTENQLKYLSYQENARHNLATENLDRNKLAETTRSNLVNEGIKTASLDETRRSNLVREGEERRSNLAREAETNRSNVAREEETRRHNEVTEGVDVANALTGGFKNVVGSTAQVVSAIASVVNPFG